MRKMRGIQINDRHQRAASGMATAFTLIEILVVLVVLLIGILAVVRLFPPGFLIISRSAEMTGANALVENQLNAEKNLLAVQESIVAYDPATGNILSNVLPDDLRDFTPGDPAIGGVDPYYVSNGNRYRKIM